MRRTILMMLLAVVSSSAAAEWVEITKSSDGQSTIYTDFATIRKVGYTVTMWELYDFKTAVKPGNDAPYLSLKVQTEYDCKEERSRAMFYTEHSGNMGEGKVLFASSEPSKWTPVAPGSVENTSLKLVCRSK